MPGGAALELACAQWAGVQFGCLERHAWLRQGMAGAKPFETTCSLSASSFVGQRDTDLADDHFTWREVV